VETKTRRNRETAVSLCADGSASKSSKASGAENIDSIVGIKELASDRASLLILSTVYAAREFIADSMKGTTDLGYPTEIRNSSPQ